MGRPVHIIFLIDALGWEIVESFGFCRNLLHRSAPLDTVLGYSSAAIPSLLTGELPNRHGAWAMYRLAGHESPFRLLRFLPELPHPLERRIRLLVKRMIDRRDLVKGYYDLYDIPLRLLADFDIASRTDPYCPGSLPVESIFDGFESRGLSYRVWTYRTPEAENVRDLLSSIDSSERILFLYTAELDELMHRRGVFHQEVERKLSLYEGFVESIIKKAREAGRPATVNVMSDHGMTDVTKAVDVWGEITRNGYRLGKDYKAFYDSTMARFWCEESVAGGIAELLEESGWGRLLSEEELKMYGCFFEDGSYGRTLFLLSPGLMIVPSFMGREPLAAMHGYDPLDRFSKGCLLTNHPSGALPTSILGIKSFLLGCIEGGTR
ncbi:MAG: hypothetical protein GTO51_03420 [Candidatus Latescibacteria bacterium]|nr:hypothetical protein [Candidatus Latescibacterota bacterium]NIM20888.1 hypothetical protein [Candidatus Latescibacterota bacterium]NIM65023.1 hypothetical protein [Candidatus Latescibacterota bacterium]NIO01538.1 hypothetical protein [Candidatus Latescibacterota bacterium]NIO28055.1 hypothetical protein [Candidatus Latescibacterota bacterium]